MSDATEWVTVNLPAQTTLGESTAPCHIVSMSTDGMVILPTFKAQAQMVIRIGFHPHNHPRPVEFSVVVAREGAYHGNYALQVQYGDDVTEEAEAAILRLLGFDVEEPVEVQSGDVLGADEARDEPRDKGLRSYSQLLVDLPEMEVNDVTPANFDDSSKLPAVEKDLLKEVDDASLKKIYKEALSQMRSEEEKGKKKKGWFR